MGILQVAKNEQAFLKAGLLGFPGSGKTFTASMLAISIAKRLGGNKPVAFFDTESGSDFLVGKFAAEGVQLLTVKSQAFKDLMEAGKEAEKSCSVLIVDSISHVWRELCEAYKRKKGCSKLQFQHWADIKAQWAEWTNFYLNSKIHIFVLGRAGYEYDFDTDSDGKKELIKTGTKMKVESEFGFEPSLLIEMERVAKSAEPGAGWVHRAHILKDRTDTINGKAFDFSGDTKGKDATFKAFEPVLNALNIGGAHRAFDPTSSDGMFDDKGDGDWARRSRNVAIACEEIEESMKALWPGQDAKSKKFKADTLDILFGTRSWTAVQSKSMEQLQHCAKVLRELENYVQALPAEEHENFSLVNALKKCADVVGERLAGAKQTTLEDDELPAPKKIELKTADDLAFEQAQARGEV